MRLPWEPTTAPERRLLRRGRRRNGVHAVAMQRPLAWAKDFALAEDLASALDALGTPKRSRRSWGALWTAPPSPGCR